MCAICNQTKPNQTKQQQSNQRANPFRVRTQKLANEIQTTTTTTTACKRIINNVLVKQLSIQAIAFERVSRN